MKLTLPVILASGSPRRQTLLQKVGMSFTVTPADIDESVGPDLSPSDIVTQLALKKAQKVATHNRDSLVIGADTIVVLNGDILGKPSNRQEAVDMLGRLSGQTHEVYTGIALYAMAHGLSVSDFEMTRVTMDQISADDIDDYVDSGVTMDKAGGYGIQEQGAFFVSRIEGDFYTVMGFPLNKFYKLIHKHCQSMIVDGAVEVANG